MSKVTIVTQITNYLGSRKTAATSTQIVKAVGGNIGTVRARLSDLVKSGTVTSVRAASKNLNANALKYSVS